MKNYNNSFKKINILLGIFIVVGFIINIYYTDKVAIAGNSLQSIESEITNQNLLHEKLQVEYLDAASLSNLFSRANEQNYVKAEYTYYQEPEFALR